MPSLTLAGRSIGFGHPPFTIAEVGINHNGSLERAMEMIAIAKAAGVDAVKFQTFRADEFVGDPSLTFTYRSQGKEITEPMIDMFRRYELPVEAWPKLKKECERHGVLFLSTPQNVTDLEVLMKVGIPAIKVGSDDFTNLPLLKRYSASGLTMIVSCGMANLDEIRQSLTTIGTLTGYPTVLMLCVSQYPTPASDANLLRLKTLAENFPDLVLGFSDHTQGALVASVSVALGASVFEKHFTLDHNQPGPDHWFSEEPSGLQTWVEGIHLAYSALGSREVRPTPAEEKMKVLARRSIAAIRDILPGESLTDDNIGLRRPGNGLSPAFYEKVIGRKAIRPIVKGTLLQTHDFSPSSVHEN